MRPEDLKAWVDGLQKAAALSLSAQAGRTMDPLESEDRASELAQLWSEIHTWPGPVDLVRERGVEEVRSRWILVQAAFAVS